MVPVAEISSLAVRLVGDHAANLGTMASVLVPHTLCILVTGILRLVTVNAQLFTLGRADLAHCRPVLTVGSGEYLTRWGALSLFQEPHTVQVFIARLCCLITNFALTFAHHWASLEVTRLPYASLVFGALNFIVIWALFAADALGGFPAAHFFTDA